MATTSVDYPTVESTIASSARFYQMALVRAGVPTSAALKALAKGSDRYLFCQVLGNQLAIVFANERAKEDATLADTATGDDLLRLCTIYGVPVSAGAGASGAVVMNCGALPVTVAAGQELYYPATGKRYRAIVTSIVANGATFTVQCVDVGSSTNLPSGAKLLWSDPPAGAATTALVDSSGLTNGADPDVDASLRKKLISKLRSPQNGGSWAHVKAWAESAGAGIEAAYVYPALQGPSTTHVAVTVKGTADNGYGRVATAAQLQAIAAYFVKQHPEHADITLTSVDLQFLDVTLSLTTPAPLLDGGPGGGWIDKAAVRWPIPASGATGSTVGSVLAPNQFTVFASNAPTVGVTVCFWESTNRLVRTARVTAVSGASSPYTVTLDTSLSAILPGDYVFPGLEHAQSYATSFQESVALLAPGEKTADANVLPRALRRPRTSDGYPCEITTAQTTALQNAHAELSNVTYRSIGGTTSFTLPVVPPLPYVPQYAPIVFILSKIAFYP